MSLVTEQFLFLKDVIKLLDYCVINGWIVTFGEAARTIEQQQIYVKTGRSKTMQSKHLQRLAIDLNFFKDGSLIYDIALLKAIGDYWESLTPGNQWGGNWKSFKDVPHFQRGA